MTDARIIRFDLDRRARRDAQRSVEQLLGMIAAAAEAMIRSELPSRAFDSAADLVATGLPTQSMGEPGGGHGGHGDPTLGAVMSNEWVSRTMGAVLPALDRIYGELVAQQRNMGNVVAQTDARPEPDAPGSGTCARCALPVSGAEHDRLKAGLCPKCSTAWYRYRAEHPDGIVDRTEWVRRTRDEDGGAGA